MKSLKYTVIKNLNQYNEYCDILEKLIAEEPDNQDEVDLISLLIEDYNERIMENFIADQNPVELLSELLEENKLTQLELAKRLEVSPQLINDVLKYRREITKSLAIKLSQEFKISFAAFLKPYKLKKAS